MKIYVNQKVSIAGDGSKKHPYKTIQNAANVAQPGDVVYVSPGIYRENVNPRNSGTAEKRIVYKSLYPRKAIISGAQQVKGWKNVAANVWKIAIPNSFFSERNPYLTKVSGDWFDDKSFAHTGEVYINDQALYEVTNLAQVEKPVKNRLSWNPEKTLFTWYTEQNTTTDETIIWANFQGKNPNQENVEINVRQSCFIPSKEGINYITLSGFTITKAATQWAPPTAYQEGMVGPHWSKGWIIEDCDISHSKCAGISLGKYLQANNENKWSTWKYKDGTQTERDAVCQAVYEGWNKENIGSHIIRRNRIHDCGQAGIVGHLGGIFSLISDNEIYNINIRRNLNGAEIAGIKLHAAIDVVIQHNYIHNCIRGLWLDWQAQGTRVTRNIFAKNCLPFRFKANEKEVNTFAGSLGEDIWVELSHGPTLIDNNLLLSERSLRLTTQGIACVHNLFAGSICAVGIGTDNGGKLFPSNRYSPYHVAHDTKIAGFMTILHGDDKFYNNVFVQQKIRPEMKLLSEQYSKNPNDWDDDNLQVGTSVLDKFPTIDQWKQRFEKPMPNSDAYYDHLPIWSHGNIYLSGAKPYINEEHPIVNNDCQVKLKLVKKATGLYLITNLNKFLDKKVIPVSTATIPMAFEPEEKYENPDGSMITFKTDLVGNLRENVRVSPGPFAKTINFEQRIF